MSTIDSMPQAAGAIGTFAGSGSSRSRRRVPRRFFAGTVALYFLLLGTFLLSASSLRHAIPNIYTVVPLLAALSFHVAGSLFLLIMGRGTVSRWAVLFCIMTTFMLTAALCLFLRADDLFAATNPSRVHVREAAAAMGRVVHAIFDHSGWIAQTIEFAGMAIFEEAVKLLPLFFLIAAGRVKNAQAAMLCGALAGLTFGTVEAISYGFLAYPPESKPITTYLTRFFIMSPLHGVWDAIAGGLVFYLSGRWRSNAMRSPGFGAYAAAFCCGVVAHVAHNALQAILGPVTQIVTVFALLAPLYVMAKHARHRAEVAAAAANVTGAGTVSDDAIQLTGDVQVLIVCLSAFFAAASIVFCWGVALRPS
jgi:hypothetical protein